jgi:hypothetical protein
MFRQLLQQQPLCSKPRTDAPALKDCFDDFGDTGYQVLYLFFAWLDAFIVIA